MDDELRIGDVLDGFCDGAFGRDFYGPGVVIGLGQDWVVVRHKGQPWFGIVRPSTLVEFRTEAFSE